MTRIFTDGAESGDGLFFNSGGSVYTPARSGVYSYNAGYVPTKFFPEMSEFYIRFAFWDNVLAGTAIFVWRRGGTTIGYLGITNTTKKIGIVVNNVVVATGTLALNTSTWYLLEVHVKIADTGGIIEVKIDGVMDCSYSGDTKPGTDAVLDNVFWQRTSQTTLIDDLAMNDTTGTVDNSWCGDGRVIALKPNANGDSSQWTGNDGNSIDNYLLVDEAVQDGDTTYVSSGTTDAKDLYGVENLSVTGVTIKRVWTESVARGDTGTAEQIAHVIKTNGSEYDSPNLTLGISYARQTGTAYTVNPQTGAAWTISEVNNLQVGPKVK